MLSSAKLGHALQEMPTILDAVRKFRDFLEDELGAAAIEYIALSAGIAVAIMKAVKPADVPPDCHTCGRPMRFLRGISEFRRHPELRIYECDQCRETAVEEWRPPENTRRRLPNSRQGAKALVAGLTVLRQRWGLRNFDIAIIFAAWAGSIIFGWKQQPFWLIVPLAICIAYTSFLIGRDSAWAARGPGLRRREIFATWTSARAAGVALFGLLRTFLSAGVKGRSQTIHDDVPRRDLALETICPRGPLLFFANQKITFVSHNGINTAFIRKIWRNVSVLSTRTDARFREFSHRRVLNSPHPARFG